MRGIEGGANTTMRGIETQGGLVGQGGTTELAGVSGAMDANTGMYNAYTGGESNALGAATAATEAAHQLRLTIFRDMR